MSYIEQEVITSLKDLGNQTGQDLFSEIFSLFQSETAKMTSSIELSLEKCDYVSIGKLAHSFKSSCANIGAVKMAELCKSIETICYEEAGFDKIPSIFSELKSITQGTIDEINQI